MLLIAASIASAPLLFRWTCDRFFGATLKRFSRNSSRVLLYKYTSKGDIEILFSHWFDTHIGNKKEQISYTAIASAMGCEPQDILFISDNSDECDAAKSAGLHTLYSLREGNPQQEARDHPIISNLDDVDQWLNPK